MSQKDDQSMQTLENNHKAIINQRQMDNKMINDLITQSKRSIQNSLRQIEEREKQQSGKKVRET